MSAALESLNRLHKDYELPLGDWGEAAVSWLNTNVPWLFDAILWPVQQVLDAVEGALTWLPWYVVILLIGLVAWRLRGYKAAFIYMGLMLFLSFLDVDIWDFAMTTLAMILAAVAICAAVGIPIGIWAARRDRVDTTIRPLLDGMQTVHPFVYLIPTVILFGIGTGPGTLATVIFALPPMVRLTNLGIRQVPGETVEAARAFGSTDRQTLFEVQIPLARPAIMAGLNQSLMLSYSMVVIAAIILAGGLGQQILRGVNTLNIPLGVNYGLGVLILAVILDRLTQTQRQTEQ